MRCSSWIRKAASSRGMPLQHPSYGSTPRTSGRAARDLYTADDQSAGWPQAELSAAAHGGVTQSEGWKVRQGGEHFWAETSITAVSGDDGQLQGFVYILRDLSEKKRMEALEAEGKRVQEFIAMRGRNGLDAMRCELSEGAQAAAIAAALNVNATSSRPMAVANRDVQTIPSVLI